jgi:hypothetical protein
VGSASVFRERNDGEEKVTSDEKDGDKEEYPVDAMKALTNKEDEMKVENLYVPNMGFPGHSLTVRHCGLLVPSIDLPPGTRF